MDSAPPWLDEEPELLTLLHAVIDRFDQQPGELRQQPLYFSTEKYLPTLRKQNSAADQLWRFVLDLQQRELLTIRGGKRGAYDAEWKNSRLGFLLPAETILRQWLHRPAGETVIANWRHVVQQHSQAFPGDLQTLLKRRLTLTGFSDTEIITALSQINTLDDQLTLRQLSACIFRGDSKLLDDREELIRALFPQRHIKPRPLVVAVHLPTACRGVLFIENQDNYVAAITDNAVTTNSYALIYAAGFRGSAERIREHGTTVLHYAGQTGDQELFEAWWFNRDATPPGPLYFFGDLDFSGMAILANLRNRFGEVTAWETGYAPLLAQLQKGGGHVPDSSRKQQSDPGTTGCIYADTILLPAIRQFGFIDQEISLSK